MVKNPFVDDDDDFLDKLQKDIEKEIRNDGNNNDDDDDSDDKDDDNEEKKGESIISDNSIYILMIELFLVDSDVQDCEWCERFLNSRTYLELSQNFRKYISKKFIKRFIYRERKCEWLGLNRPRFCDNEVRESNNTKLPYDIDRRTDDYLLIYSRAVNFPAIRVTSYHNNGIFKRKIFSGLMIEKEDSSVDIRFFRYILSYLSSLGNQIPEDLRDEFTHDTAKYDKKNFMLYYEDKIKIDEDQIQKKIREK